MNEPSKNSALLGEAFLEAIRQAVREEIKAAISQNGAKEGNRLISAKEAAKLWEVPKSWIESMARQGVLPHVQLGVYKRFNPDDLEQFIKENRK